MKEFYDHHRPNDGKKCSSNARCVKQKFATLTHGIVAVAASSFGRWSASEALSNSPELFLEIYGIAKP